MTQGGIALLMFLIPWLMLQPGQTRAAIIGTDDRIEWHEEKTPALRLLGRSTAILIEKSAGWLAPHGAGYTLTKSTPTHGSYDRLCQGVRFREQLAPGACTGFLVAPDLLVTADHCLKPDCHANYFVFDFLNTAFQERGRDFRRDQVFTCQNIVERNSEEDWALVRLSRPTQNRVAFTSSSAPTAMGTPLVMLGYPRGVPLKHASHATAAAATFSSEEVYFEADLDAFGGNSGSPVVNAKTFALEGMLVVAFGEFEPEEICPHTKQPCRRLRTFSEADATNVWALRASRFEKAVRAAIR